MIDSIGLQRSKKEGWEPSSAACSPAQGDVESRSRAAHAGAVRTSGKVMAMAESTLSGSTPTTQRARPPEKTGWVGWIIFAACMLMLVGAFHAVAGLVALFKDEYYLVSKSGLVVNVDYTAWGWVHLVIGVVLMLTGWFLWSGSTWARHTAAVLAGISALVNLAFLAAYPWWSAIMIALDVLVIYAVTVHGGEPAD